MCFYGLLRSGGGRGVCVCTSTSPAGKIKRPRKKNRGCIGKTSVVLCRLAADVSLSFCSRIKGGVCVSFLDKFLASPSLNANARSTARKRRLRDPDSATTDHDDASLALFARPRWKMASVSRSCPSRGKGAVTRARPPRLVGLGVMKIYTEYTSEEAVWMVNSSIVFAQNRWVLPTTNAHVVVPFVPLPLRDKRHTP